MFSTLVELFGQRRKILHRLLGLSYLIHYVILLIFLSLSTLSSNPTFHVQHSHRIFYLQLHGILQTITALFAFRFLRHIKAEQNYFTDKSTIPYKFIQENIFFCLQLLFLAAYVNPSSSRYLRTKFQFIEALFVFFPFQFLRPLFPKTSLSKSLATDKKTDGNQSFMRATAILTKLFFIFGKHLIGFFLNYCLFTKSIKPDDLFLLSWVGMGGAYNLTIGIFLHTLKFKKYMGMRTSVSLYCFGFLISGAPASVLLFRLAIRENIQLWLLVAGGLIVQFIRGTRGNVIRGCYQAFVYAALTNRLSIGS